MAGNGLPSATLGIDSLPAIKTRKQEAQLSQTGRATFHVVVNFAKSVEVTQDH